MSDPVVIEKPAVDPTMLRAKELIDTLWNDKDVGATLRAKAKEKYPDIEIPEDKIDPLIAPVRAEAQALRDELKAMREERDADKKARDDAAAANDFESKLSAARAKFPGLTVEGYEKAIERMRETANYTDPEAAMAWVAQQTPPPAQPGPYLGPQNIDLWGSSEKDEKFALLHQDPGGKFLDAELRDFATDPDRYVREAFAA